MSFFTAWQGWNIILAQDEAGLHNKETHQAGFLPIYIRGLAHFDAR